MSIQHLSDLTLSEPLPCLNFMQQIEVMSKARLCLSLAAPNDDATLEEKLQHYEEQRERILNFVNLLSDTMVCEHGKVLLCLYQLR
jgi:hypothetical protein